MKFINYWIVREKGTDKIIPISKGWGGRGGSHAEPIEIIANNPRLFRSEATAKGWLTMWLKGKIVSSYSTTEFGTEYDSNETQPVPERSREKMEIVKVRLSIP